jgi:uncharacterized protein involved in exopolysaccharide biosynthesis
MAAHRTPTPERAVEEGDGVAESYSDGHELNAPVPAIEERRGRPSLFWFSARAITRYRWFVVGFSALAAVAAVVVALLLPVQYTAQARVLLPFSSGGGLSALIGGLSPVGGAILGSGAKDYNRYLAILTSRSLQDQVVERFDLVQRYGTDDERDPMGAAREELTKRTVLEVDMKYDFLTIAVRDADPRRAAQMANFLVDELNVRNQQLSSQSAGGQRRYVEARYREAELALDSLRAEMQRFQEANGVVELPAMAEALITSLASARAELARAEVEYQALRAQYGDDNPQVQAARDVYTALQRTQDDLLSGRDRTIPVPMQRLPALSNEYGRLYQDVLVQTKIMEVTRPLLEQARFAEEQERMAVQVLDRAVPPVLKSHPQRAVIVIVTTFSAFMLALLMAVAYEWLRRNRAYLASRFRAA